MKKHTLSAQKRTVTGKKVKQLRAEGLVPAGVYGKDVKSISVSVNEKEFLQVHKAVGSSGLVELSVGSDMRPVLIHHVQVDPVHDTLLHIEFHQVNLKEKVTAKIPLEFTGESPAVAQKLGVLLTVMNTVEVEGLPGDLPEHIIVDVSSLSEVDAEITAGGVPIPSGVTLVTDPELTIVKVGALVTKEALDLAAQEEAEKASQAAESGETGETDAAKSDETQKPNEETKTSAE